MNLFDWIKTLFGTGVIEDFKPVIGEGEAVSAALLKLLTDLRAGNVATSVADAKQIASDVTAFGVDVERVVTDLMTKAPVS